MKSDRKKRIVLDAGDNTALFIEQNSNGDYLATMYPFRESDLTLRKWKSIANYIVLSVLLFVSLTMMSYGIASVLSEAYPDYRLLFFLLLFGAFLGSARLSQYMFLKNKELVNNDDMVYVREILRSMRAGTSGEIEQYSIKASYLYNGMDGDFITWYKQEKNRSKNQRSWNTP